MTRKNRRAGATAALVTLGLLIAWPTAAQAQTTTSSGGASDAALITPLLRLFDFGDVVGLPLACNVTSSLVATGAAQAGSPAAISAVESQIVSQCATLSAEGDSYLKQAIAESQGLSLINPALDPVIASMASATQNFGANYGSSLAPFGPTIAGLGGTVAFFEGTSG